MATRTISTDIVLTGEKAFNDAMKGVNNNLKNLRTDMAVLSSEFDGNAESMEALTAKEKLLAESVAQHQAKVNALNEMYQRQVQLNGENSAKADEYKQKLNQATVALNKEKSALEKTTDAIKKNAEAMGKAEADSNKYVPVTQKLASALKKPGEAFKDLKKEISDAVHELPVFAELADIAGVSAKGLGAAAKVGGTALKGIGTAAGATAKGIGLITAASAVGVAAIGAGGVVALGTMVSMAREAAEAAKAAQEAGETLTESQQQWLAYSNQLDALDASVASAKGALAGVLLPVLSDLSTEGAAFLNDFSRDMQAAAGNTGAQTKVLSDYIVKGAQLIKAKLPEYIATGKELFQGLSEGLGGENGDELFDMGIDLVMSLLDGIIEYAPDLAEAGIQLVQRLTESLIERGPDLVTAAVGMVTQIVQGLAQAAPDLIPMAGQLVVTLIQALISAAPDLLLAGMELIYGIVSGLIEGLGDIREATGDIIDAIKQAFSDSAQTFLDIGSQIVAKIKQGISDAWAGVVSWFKGLVSSLTANISVNVSGSRSADGSHAGGLDYVPFDGYIAELHRGEMVLTSAEADWYRRGNALGRGTVQKVFNLTINTQSLSKSDLDMLVDYVNGKLGDDL